MPKNPRIELVKGGRKVNGEFQANPPKSADPSIINTGTLKPQADFDLPPVAPSTEMTGELGRFQAQADTFTKNLERQAEQAGTAESQSFASYIQAQLGAPTEAELRSSAYGVKGGVDSIQGELDSINSRIMAEQRALELQQRELDKNTAGLFGGALDDEKRRVEKESLQKQADLAVIQMSVQGRYDSAKEIADRAIDAQLAADKRRLDALALVYDRNKSLFDKSEQRAFESAQADRQNALEEERAEKKLLSSTKLAAMQMAQSNGAPSSVIASIQSATTPEDVIRAGGQWGNVDMLEREYKRAQIANSYTNRLLALAEAGDQNAIDKLGFDPREVKEEKLDPTQKRQYEETARATESLLGMARQYKSLVDSSGYTNEFFGDSTKLGQIDNLRAQMIAGYKKAETLGTLDKGVLDLMGQLLGQKPTSSIFGRGDEGNIFANFTGRRSNRLSSSLNEFINTLEKENAHVNLKLGNNPVTDPLGLGTGTNDASNPLGI